MKESEKKPEPSNEGADEVAKFREKLALQNSAIEKLNAALEKVKKKTTGKAPLVGLLFSFVLEAKKYLLLLLLLVFALKVDAIVIHPEEPFEGITAYVDSLKQHYQTGSADQKLEASFALWSMYHHESLFKEEAIPLVQVIDSHELAQYINTRIKESNEPDLKEEWRLLQLRRRIEKNPGYKSDFDTEHLNKELLAAYYIVASGELSLFDINGFKHLDKFKKCYAIAKTNRSLAPFEFLCLRNFGMAQFHKNNIDSSVYYFEKIIPVCQKISHWSYKYVPGYGVYYRQKQTQGRMHMNLGMSIEKTGNIVKAIQQYEKGERQFDSCAYHPGTWWGKSQIINSYLDLEEYERAETILSELVNSIKNYFGQITIDNEFLWTGLHEFDYFDLYENRFFLDSLLSSIENEGGFPTFRRRLKTRDPLEYSYQQRYTTVRLALKYMTDKQPISTDIFNTIDSLKTNYLKDPLIEYATKNYIYNSMKFNEAAWRVALDQNGNQTYLNQLLKFAQQSDSVYNYNGHFTSILILFHALGKYDVEEQLIRTYLPRVEKGNDLIAQRKLYYQYADALQYLGRFEEALEYFHKSDRIKQQLKTLNHLEQLDNLDRRLEIERARRVADNYESENQLLKVKRNRWVLVTAFSILVMLLSLALYTTSKRKHLVEKERQMAEVKLLEKDVEKKEHALENTTLELVKSNINFNQLLLNLEGLITEMKTDTKKKARSVLMEYKAKLQDETWQRFNLEFENANAHFYSELKKINSTLTNTELQIAAMHLSGLSNKEITAITGKQSGSIHTHKSHLRRKLGVANEQELTILVEKVRDL